MVNISNFTSGFGNPLSANEYLVGISEPGGDYEWYDNVETLTIPGKGIGTVQRRLWGPMIDFPYDRVFAGEIELTFAVTEENAHESRNKFSKWMDKVILPETGSINPDRDSYTGFIEIILPGRNDAQNNDVSRLIFAEVFPKNINPVSLGYGLQNEYVRQTITFSFRDYMEYSREGRSGTFGTGQLDL